MALTERKRRFVKEYLIDLNATQAAIRAGYSEKTAYSQGQRLLKDVEINGLIQKEQQKRAESMISRKIGSLKSWPRLLLEMFGKL